MSCSSAYRCHYQHIRDMLEAPRINSFSPTSFSLCFYNCFSPIIDCAAQLIRSLYSSLILPLFSGGYMSNSLAIMTDAVHMLADVLGILFSLLALWLSTKPPSKKFTFGLHRLGECPTPDTRAHPMHTSLHSHPHLPSFFNV